MTGGVGNRPPCNLALRPPEFAYCAGVSGDQVDTQPGGDDGADGYGRAVPPGEEAPGPGDIIAGPDDTLPEMAGAGNTGMPYPEPLVGLDEDTPLGEDEPEDVIPAPLLWAMKEHRHVQWHLLAADERHDRFRISLGPDQNALYAIDDGRHHATIGHPVGASPESCDYFLVARITMDQLDRLQAGEVAPPNAFDDAHELALLGVNDVAEARTANVFTVASYGSVDEVPLEFLPGTPFISFRQDLTID